jgi:hypothetical protein
MDVRAGEESRKELHRLHWGSNAGRIEPGIVRRKNEFSSEDFGVMLVRARAGRRVPVEFEPRLRGLVAGT